jgi:crotonobetainyl-CoA:carnitine CoA-transferase CaiB-like acyl-CoA transferase
VRTIDELATDARLEARGMLMHLILDSGETMLTPGAPIRIADAEPPPAIRAPQLGEHTQAVLAEWLGE